MSEYSASEQVKELSAALLTFHGAVPDIPKDADNPFFKSKYAPLDTILPAIRPALQKAGIVFVQIPHGESALTTRIMHVASGQWIEGTMVLAPKDKTPQGQGSAITYARRYALVSMLGLNTESDDDGNAATAHRPAAPAKPAAPAPGGVPKPGCITVPQARRMFALAQQAGKTVGQVKEYLADTYGVERTEDIKRGDYEAICKWIEHIPSENVDRINEDTGEIVE